MFEVGALSEVSDHCPLLFELRLKVRIQMSSKPKYFVGHQKPPHSQERPLHFILTTDAKEKIRKGFKSEVFRQSLVHLMKTFYQSPLDEGVKDFTMLLSDLLQQLVITRFKKRHAKNIFPSNNWFNNDCKKFKRSVADLAAKMKKDPENLVLRNLYWTKRKHYKILTKQAKQKAVDWLHKQLLNFRIVNHQKFWKIILKARNINSCRHIPIPAEKMKEYFEGLLNRPFSLAPVITLPSYKKDDSLDELITEDEIRLAIKRSKRKKAPGIDGIPPETFKLFDKQLLLALKTIFNRILTEQKFPESWSMGIIKPIHKSSDRHDPSNYRGITLLPIMSKFLRKL